MVPKTLANNSGHDPMEVVVTLGAETRVNEAPMGIDLETGEALQPQDAGIWDNYCVKECIYTYLLFFTNLYSELPHSDTMIVTFFEMIFR